MTPQRSPWPSKGAWKCSRVEERVMRLRTLGDRSVVGVRVCLGYAVER